MTPLGPIDPGVGGEVAAMSAPPAAPAHVTPAQKCPRDSGEKHHPAIVASWPAAWLSGQPAASRLLLLLPREQPSHSGEETIYKQEQGGAHRPVWEQKLRGE